MEGFYYHSSDRQFDKFRFSSDLGPHLGSRAQAENRASDLSADRSTRPSHLSKWKLNCSNPYFLDCDMMRWGIGDFQKYCQFYLMLVENDNDINYTAQRIAMRYGMPRKECVRLIQGGAAVAEMLGHDAAELIAAREVNDIQFVRDTIKKNGYDCVVYKNAVENKGKDNKSIIILDVDDAELVEWEY